MLQMKKRLDRLERKLGTTSYQRITVIQHVRESREDADQKIERWKAGQDEADVQSQEPYSGRELYIWYIRAVAPGSL